MLLRTSPCPPWISHKRPRENRWQDCRVEPLENCGAAPPGQFTIDRVENRAHRATFCINGRPHHHRNTNTIAYTRLSARCAYLNGMPHDLGGFSLAEVSAARSVGGERPAQSSTSPHLLILGAVFIARRLATSRFWVIRSGCWAPMTQTVPHCVELPRQSRRCNLVKLV
jgi:hypothetical protein